MTSQEAFVSALQTFSDEMIMNCVEYIETGKDFCYAPHSQEGGNVCCVIGASLRMDIHGTSEHLVRYWNKTFSVSMQDAINGFILHFHGIGRHGIQPQSKLKQLILKEAERRGLIKKELEPITREVIVP